MTHPVVEKKALLESVENDAEFLKTLIQVFLTDCPMKLAAIRVGVVRRDPEEVMKASHGLKGSVSVFGAKSAVNAAQNLESMGREGKQEGFSEAFALLEQEITLVTLALEEIANEDA
ncbi:MAG: Hpt domain-containing protein [Candidatus Acidiferrales bacterium]